MNWDEIMQMEDPHEALKAIVQKGHTELTPLEEMMELVDRYSKLHKVSVDEMSFYPNGDRVITG